MTDTTVRPEESQEFPTVASFDDPHLQPYAKHPKRAEAVVAAFLALGIVGFAGFGAVYWVNGSTQWQAVFFGVGLFAFGFALSAWGKYLLPQGPFSEDRHLLEVKDEDVAAMRAAVVDRGTMMFRRRGFLGGLLAAGAAIMGVVLAFPLVRSLGPKPGASLQTTDWKAGMRLVDINGRPLHQADLEVGSSLTVFPEGFVGESQDQVMLIRAGSEDIITKPGRVTWAPQGYVAYSKLCTHAGCPVGLYQESTQQLLCPCHQSLFDILDGAQPVFGPAPRPLPQLPLFIDGAGFIRAQSGFDQPVGPGFWERKPT
ncbi:MAG TPA: Rieske 2Fe-2S domain-containing protein [Acidimicrobiales bacterium]|nr:Rieske 2Fe-2S domain-containing protein [Acidimicrobiales bacterium]